MLEDFIEEVSQTTVKYCKTYCIFIVSYCVFIVQTRCTPQLMNWGVGQFYLIDPTLSMWSRSILNRLEFFKCYGVGV